ncbi:glutathione S-transferase E14-like isoform X2 [Leguminivora glycinivorella]|nr:glutathione S-transferase E14-like isoform X2 [Leguminivora glycinivorella]XP_047996846.1 glutathione S-transferase E14-like isoform X2 [Leguminivora glycinivorella]
MNNKLILYGDEVSPPVRFALMVASMLDIKLDYQHIDLFKAENKSPFYTKINPLQKVPALKVGDEVICDSHAIALYLCRIGDGQRLYPEDPVVRAKVDQTMFFNSGTLFPIDSFIYTEYFRGKWPANDEKIKEWHSAVDHLEHLLDNQMWLAYDKVTLADLCCASTVSSLQLLVPPLDRHVKVKQWLGRLPKLSCYEINLRGLELLKSKLQS